MSGNLHLLMPMPDVPKFDDKKTGLHLALIGSMNDNNLDMTELAYQLIKILSEHYPDALRSRYQIAGNEDPVEVLYQIAEVRGCKLKGNRPDIDKTSSIILDDFRSGKLGKITLDRI